MGYLHVYALSLVSYHSSYAVHPDKFSHNEHPLLCDTPDSGDSPAFVMPDTSLFVKYHDLAKGEGDETQEYWSERLV